MEAKLKDKVAIVTGAGQGIGKGIAEVLSREGASILIVDINEKLASITANELKLKGRHASFFVADVTDLEQMREMARNAYESFGRLDVLCQNVGIYPPRLIEEMTETEWDDVLSVNLKGTFLSVQACLPYLKKSKCGRIVITSSITGPRTAIPGLAHYAASKSGINGFIKVAALELAKYNIMVNGVEPGNILTENLAQTLGQEYVNEAQRSVPLGRLGSPQDVGNAVLFLSSEESSFITGQTIVVDGGQILPENKLS